MHPGCPEILPSYQLPAPLGLVSGVGWEGERCIPGAGADPSGGGGDELRPWGAGRGGGGGGRRRRAVDAEAEVRGRGRGGGPLSTPALGTVKCAAWLSRGGAGRFLPVRLSAAAAAAADVEERSAEAGARRPLLFI